jgi:hypothetical protein
MQKVFQEVLEIATAKLRQALSQDQAEGSAQEWDPDAFEEQVRDFSRQLAQRCLKVWAEEKVKKAQAKAACCPCGRKRQSRKRKALWWQSTFGKVKVEEPYLVCPSCRRGERPFQRLSGLRCRGLSKALRRVLTDFGAEKSFQSASHQLLEHYGVHLGRGSIRRVVEAEAQRAESFFTRRLQEAKEAYGKEKGVRKGAPFLIVESDGSMVRTGKLKAHPEGGLSPKRGLGRRLRETAWREVRLSVVQRPDEDKRLYGAVLGTPKEVGSQMWSLALLAGWGEHTKVHGVGDGAFWIPQQMGEVFPRLRYLLDRYHLLERLYCGAQALPAGLSGPAWVGEQLERIDRGEPGVVVAQARLMAGGDGEHPLGQLARFLENHPGYLDYASAQEEGLPIGSGMVEGGHRHVIQERLKLPGAWWKEDNVGPMLALRALRENGWWEDLWT